MIQVADIVTSGATVWEDGGQECHVCSPPQTLMKSIRHMLLVKQGGRGQKIQVQAYNNVNEEKGSFLKKDSFLCTFVEAIFFFFTAALLAIVTPSCCLSSCLYPLTLT